MQTLLLLVDDTYAETLKQSLPDDKAWILPERYDTFRCQVRQALETYKNDPSECMPLGSAMEMIDRAIETES